MKTRPYWTRGASESDRSSWSPSSFFWPRAAAGAPDPCLGVPEHATHVSRADILLGPFETPQDVTRACLACHPDAAAVTVLPRPGCTGRAPRRSSRLTVSGMMTSRSVCITTTSTAGADGVGFGPGSTSLAAGEGPQLTVRKVSVNRMCVVQEWTVLENHVDPIPARFPLISIT
jgi:hypothetical protein